MVHLLIMLLRRWAPKSSHEFILLGRVEGGLEHIGGGHTVQYTTSQKICVRCGLKTLERYYPHLDRELWPAVPRPEVIPEYLTTGTERDSRAHEAEVRAILNQFMKGKAK